MSLSVFDVALHFVSAASSAYSNRNSPASAAANAAALAVNVVTASQASWREN